MDLQELKTKFQLVEKPDFKTLEWESDVWEPEPGKKIEFKTADISFCFNINDASILHRRTELIPKVVLTKWPKTFALELTFSIVDPEDKEHILLHKTRLNKYAHNTLIGAKQQWWEDIAVYIRSKLDESASATFMKVDSLSQSFSSNLEQDLIDIAFKHHGDFIVGSALRLAFRGEGERALGILNGNFDLMDEDEYF